MSQETTSSLPPGKQEIVRRCGRGSTNLIWHVTDNVAHLTVPDLTCTIRTDIVTLEGVYQLELNRFDAASRYVRWQQPLEDSPPIIGSSHPNDGQKQALCKYLRFLHSHWADTGTTPPGPTSGLAPTGLLPSQGRYPAPLYTSSGLGYPRRRPPPPGNGPYRRPRVIIPVNTGVPLPDHPRPVGAPATAPLNMNSPYSNNPRGGTNFIPLSNGTYYIQSGTPILRAELAGNQAQQAGNVLNYMGHKTPMISESPSQAEDSMDLSETPRSQESGAPGRDGKPRCPTPYPEVGRTGQDCMSPPQAEDTIKLSEAPGSQEGGAPDRDGKPRCPTPYPENTRARQSYIPGLSQVDEENLRLKLKRKSDPSSGLELWIAETKSLKREGAGTPDSIRATDSPASPSPKSREPDEVFK